MLLVSALESFGSFRELVEIGRGGMSVVYRARDAQGQIVALKLLAPHVVSQPSAWMRFQQEATLSLLHPNIVRVLAAGVEQGVPYLVMEYVRGESLERRVRRCGALSPAEAVRLVEDVARALDFVHRRGIIHRDVKPSNILIREDGRAQLTDFGVAKLIGATHYTATNVRVGSVHYMAPEQVLGSYAITKAADIYALGATAFYALAARPPFEGENEIAIARQHVEQPPPSVSEFNPAVTQAASAVIQWAMDKSPAKRPPMAGTFARALKAAFESPAPLPARRALPARRTAAARTQSLLEGRRFWLALAIVMAILLLMFALVLVAIFESVSTRSALLPTPSAAPRALIEFVPAPVSSPTPTARTVLTPTPTRMPRALSSWASPAMPEPLAATPLMRPRRRAPTPRPTRTPRPTVEPTPAPTPFPLITAIFSPLPSEP